MINLPTPGKSFYGVPIKIIPRIRYFISIIQFNEGEKPHPLEIIQYPHPFTKNFFDPITEELISEEFIVRILKDDFPTIEFLDYQCLKYVRTRGDKWEFIHWFEKYIYEERIRRENLADIVQLSPTTKRPFTNEFPIKAKPSIECWLEQIKFELPIVEFQDIKWLGNFSPNYHTNLLIQIYQASGKMHPLSSLVQQEFLDCKVIQEKIAFYKRYELNPYVEYPHKTSEEQINLNTYNEKDFNIVQDFRLAYVNNILEKVYQKLEQEILQANENAPSLALFEEAYKKILTSFSEEAPIKLSGIRKKYYSAYKLGFTESIQGSTPDHYVYKFSAVEEQVYFLGGYISAKLFGKIFSNGSSERKTIPNMNGRHPGILNTPNVIPELVESLSKYFPPDDKKLLEKVLQGEKIPRKLSFKGASNQFIGVWKRIRELNLVHQDILQHELATWICEHFCYWKSTEKKMSNFDFNYVYIQFSKDDGGSKKPINLDFWEKF